MTVAPTPVHGRQAPHRAHLVLFAALVVFALGVVLLVQHDVFQGSSSLKGLQGSGVAATQSRELAAFRGIELAGANNVIVRVGGKQSVVVHADDNLLGHVTTQVHGGSLVIGNTTGSFTTKSPMRVEVSVRSLASLTLSGSGIISVTGIKAQSMTVRLSGGGVVH